MSPGPDDVPIRPPSSALDTSLEGAALGVSLNLARGFSLLFAVCNQTRLREDLIRGLREDLAPADPIVIPLDGSTKSLSDLVLRRFPDPPDNPVFITGLEVAVPNSEEAHRSLFIANLNAARDVLGQFLRRPLVLWLPEYVLHAIQRGAPDFFSIHSGVFRFAEAYASIEKAAQGALETPGLWTGDTAEEKGLRLAETERLLAEYRARPPDRRDAKAEAALLARLMRLYIILGRHDDAEAAGRQAKALAESLYGANSPVAGRLLNDIGGIFHKKGDLQGALAAYQDAERIARAAFGDDHPKVAACVNNIGTVRKDKGDLDGALAAFREAERIDRAAFGDDHPEVATDVNNIGSVLQDKGDLDGALDAYREAERIDRAAFGDDHPEVAIRVNNIGSVLHDKGDLDGALAAHREAERIERAAFGDDHPNVARDINNIGSVLFARGDHGGAAEMSERAFDICIRRLGPRSLSTLNSARNLQACGRDPVALARRIAGDEAAEELAGLL